MVTGKRSDDTLIIVLLSIIGGGCILGIVALSITSAVTGVGDGKNDALLTIGSLCVGALASRVSQKAASTDERKGGDTETYELIGRAATKQIIADALRQMERE